jgi:hypothetical protein
MDNNQEPPAGKQAVDAVKHYNRVRLPRSPPPPPRFTRFPPAHSPGTAGTRDVVLTRYSCTLHTRVRFHPALRRRPLPLLVASTIGPLSSRQQHFQALLGASTILSPPLRPCAYPTVPFLADQTTPFTVRRWGSTGVAFLLFAIRIFWAQAYYIVAYALGSVHSAFPSSSSLNLPVFLPRSIYLLNLFLAFITPKFDPAAQEDMAATEAEEGAPGLPTSQGDLQDGEFRPFIRRLPEFKFWYVFPFPPLPSHSHSGVLTWRLLNRYGATRAIAFSLVASFIPVFDVPVFWPILVMYFCILTFITLRRQISHMRKYRYIAFLPFLLNPFPFSLSLVTLSSRSEIFSLTDTSPSIWDGKRPSATRLRVRSRRWKRIPSYPSSSSTPNYISLLASFLLSLRVITFSSISPLSYRWEKAVGSGNRLSFAVFTRSMRRWRGVEFRGHPALLSLSLRPSHSKRRWFLATSQPSLVRQHSRYPLLPSIAFLPPSSLNMTPFPLAESPPLLVDNKDGGASIQRRDDYQDALDQWADEIEKVKGRRADCE